MVLHVDDDSLICDALARQAATRPEAVAAVDPQTSLTYGGLARRVAEVAGQLEWCGVTPGMRVLLGVSQSVSYLVDYLAALTVRAHVLPLDSGATDHEIERDISTHTVHALVKAGTEPLAARLDVTLCARTNATSGSGLVSLTTSGTSGLPKRATQIQSRLVGNALAHARSVGAEPSDVCMVALSPAFGYCHTAQILSTLVTGGQIVFARRPALPNEIARVVAEHGVTTTSVVPQMLTDQMLSALGGCTSLRQILVGGSAMSADLRREVMGRLPHSELVHTWGITEAGPRISTWRSRRDAHRKDSVGLALDGVSVRRAPATADDGRRGTASDELVVRSPFLMRGYLDDDQASDQVLVTPDTLATGDLGYVDNDGYVFLTGRSKSVIDVGGKKVSPEEIEAVLLAFPGIAAVRVSAVESKTRGFEPVAEVVSVEGATLDVGLISSHARSRLSRHKWPCKVTVVESLPVTSTGKTRRW